MVSEIAFFQTFVKFEKMPEKSPKVNIQYNFQTNKNANSQKVNRLD
jgi:hypothetical protein|tara:strand:+ start:31283 stop:31420 length:138 start_codon:yes stop_codon:yes gene_type:complete